jgi:hypothetical protein
MQGHLERQRYEAGLTSKEGYPISYGTITILFTLHFIVNCIMIFPQQLCAAGVH